MYPDKRKAARVTPIFNSGQKSEIYDLKYISLLSGVSRLVEKVAHVQFFEFLTAISLIQKPNCLSKAIFNNYVIIECS